MDEAHVEHAVGLVEDEHLDAVEAQVALAHQVEQAAGRRHHHVDAAAQRLHLGALADAAEDHRVRDAQVAAVGAEAVADLRGELARGGQHQAAHRARLALLRGGLGGRQALQDGQGEGGGLAGAGLGAAEEVAAGERRRDGLLLDRRGGVVALVAQRAQQGFAQAEFGEMHAWSKGSVRGEAR